jgi:hypothetical protein
VPLTPPNFLEALLVWFLFCAPTYVRFFCGARSHQPLYLRKGYGVCALQSTIKRFLIESLAEVYAVFSAMFTIAVHWSLFPTGAGAYPATSLYRRGL